MAGMVSKRLEEFIKFKDMNIHSFERSINMTATSLYNSIKGHRSIRSDTLERILKAYPDLNPIWLFTGKGNMILSEEIQSLPINHTPSIEVNTKLGIFSIPSIPTYDGAAYISGDSMYPLLKSGDIVLYSVVQDLDSDIKWGELYHLKLDIDGEEYR